MNITLKPLGVVALIGAIGLLSFLALLKPGANAPVTPVVVGSPAQPNNDLIVYKDSLENRWMERGWAKTVDYANSAPVHGSTGLSIRVVADPFEAVKIYNPNAKLAKYKYFNAFVCGGDQGGQVLSLYTVAAGKTMRSVIFPALPVGKWVQISVPLKYLDIEGRDDVTAFWLQNATSNPSSPFYVDDITFSETAPQIGPEAVLTYSENPNAGNNK